MTPTRRLKKSESLEIRIPYPTKQAFMARCQDEGRSASEVIRDFIDGRLDDQPQPAERRRTWRLAAGALVAAALGAVALPSLARPGAPAEFQRLDLNGDGRISAAELARLDTNHDGVISLAEYKAR